MSKMYSKVVICTMVCQVYNATTHKSIVVVLWSVFVLLLFSIPTPQSSWTLAGEGELARGAGKSTALLIIFSAVTQKLLQSAVALKHLSRID